MSEPSRQMTLQEGFDLGLSHYQAGRLDAAKNVFEQLVLAVPEHADSHHMLGMVLLQTGETDASLPHIEQAVRLNPQSPLSRTLLAMALIARRQFREAIAAAQSAIAIMPEMAEAHQAIGQALLDLGNAKAAETSLRRAVSIRQDQPDAFYLLGRALWDNQKLSEAAGAWQRAIQLRPDFPEAYNNLGVAYGHAGDVDRAADTFQAAVRYRPNFAEAYSNLGNTFKDRALMADALRNYRKAIACNPKSQPAWSNLLYGMTFDPDSDAAAIAKETDRWDIQIARPIREKAASHANNKDPDRRLKIGYVSPDFYAQSESFFVLPLVGAHDHERYEIHCYSSVGSPDEVTNRIKARADRWHEVRPLTDVQLASKIREDQIDVLIDLTMQMTQNRILLFAQKPAPVQIAWLAYPGTTGLRNMDYRISDVWMDPQDSDQNWSAEQVIRLPRTWCVYAPLESPLPVAPLPALSSGSITFGSMNNFTKTGPAVLDFWAETLAAVPSSRLILACPPGSTRKRIESIFSAKGVSGDRLSLIPLQERLKYLRTYDQIDIALDPFPYNGITTTCDAMLQGVPVLTLAGRLPQSRAGLSLLKNVGLDQFITESREQFIQRAVELAGDLQKLSAIRQMLREMMQKSPLMDASAFAGDFEHAIRGAWRTYCGS